MLDRDVQVDDLVRTHSGIVTIRVTSVTRRGPDHPSVPGWPYAATGDIVGIEEGYEADTLGGVGAEVAWWEDTRSPRAGDGHWRQKRGRPLSPAERVAFGHSGE